MSSHSSSSSNRHPLETYVYVFDAQNRLRRISRAEVERS